MWVRKNHKEIWRLFGPPLAFTVVAMPRQEGVPNVTWVPDAPWLLFTRPGGLSLLSEPLFIFPMGMTVHFPSTSGL